MDAATIAGCRAKIDRAEEAIEEMGGKWRAWVDSNPYPSRVEADRQVGEHHIYFDFGATRIPPVFAVLLGEIAHDMRSALDHLVWREAVEALGREPTDDEARDISFPIYRTRVKFKKSKVQRYVDPDAWTVIERHQPYDRGKPKRSKSLELLHWINRIDKHRFISASRPFLLLYNPLEIVEWKGDGRLLAAIPTPGVIGRPLKRETEIACLHFDPLRPQPKVRVNGTPPLNISLGNAPRYIRSLTTTGTLTEVRRVVDDFAALAP
ncbi:MAG: hypothetical protein ACLPUT_10820 [Solirubrobacteraceae bacterium]